jgi:3-methylcrotonyl-CoA carboxylase alpha subunit
LAANGELRADLDGRRLSLSVVAAKERRHIFLNGRVWIFSAVDPLFQGDLGGAHEGQLVAPMPGKVIALLGQIDALLDKGAPLMILEAMKMEHTIVAPCRGRLNAFRYAVGDQVADGAELVEFSPEAAA